MLFKKNVTGRGSVCVRKTQVGRHGQLAAAAFLVQLVEHALYKCVVMVLIPIGVYFASHDMHNLACVWQQGGMRAVWNRWPGTTRRRYVDITMALAFQL